MRTAIIGCGAMGSVYAGRLAAAGTPVLAIDKRIEHVDSINHHGLRLSGPDGEQVIALRASTTVPSESMDLVILAVKSSDVKNAAQAILPLLDTDTVVLAIQNGLGSAHHAAEVVGADRLAIGVASGFGASLKAPGEAHHNAMNALHFGAYRGLTPETVLKVVEVWRAAGFDADMVSDIVAIQWEKLICNVAYSALCALTGMTIGEILNDSGMRSLSADAATEAWLTARAGNVGVTITDPVQYVRDFGARMPDAKPSLLLDHEARRPSEIDIINGAIPREAAKLGRTAPVNATLTALVQAKERQWH